MRYSVKYLKFAYVITFLSELLYPTHKRIYFHRILFNDGYIMIEDNIQILRQAARVSSEEDVKKIWCVIAGNDKLVNDIAYSAIASKKTVKIIFREHVSFDEGRISKKFDFIILKGDSMKIREITRMSKDKGSAAIVIAPYYVENENNLMTLVGPEDAIKKFVNDTEEVKAPISILLDDQTTGFIETDLQLSKEMPGFIKNIITPLFNVSDVVLTTILISVENDEDVTKIQKIATANKIFVIDIKDIMEE